MVPGPADRQRLLPLHIGAAFEVIVSRIDTARAAGSADPMRTISTSLAGPNSRAITHRMLASLGYSPSQRRIVHRLLSGSASGWPGLLMLFATGANLTATHRRYVCLLYTSDAADDLTRVDLGGRRIIKKK